MSVAPTDNFKSQPPPPYNVGEGAQPVQQAPTQQIYVQPAVVQPIAIVVEEVKETSCREPYMEYCPRCRITVMTRTEEKIGSFWWILFIIGLILFWPALCCLCCKISKDVRHMCPNCGTMVSCSKKGC
ncbi:unnamed protein product [Caenorhabditis bovis]|uniref:LITAF domain-containing protein n=1 Tax=Caenorhabditis bovis TaxID=2654633 RepID=A0A8S1EQI5_9PELO|nr:unnamed protein product [Caenorhabditis bovis]